MENSEKERSEGEENGVKEMQEHEEKRSNVSRMQMQLKKRKEIVVAAGTRKVRLNL